MKTRFQIILLLVVAGFVTNVQRQGVLIPDQFPPLKRWALAWNGYESRQGRQNVAIRCGVFFRPSGAWMDSFDILPAMNRWAIVGRPCGTTNSTLSTLGVQTTIIN